MALKLALSPPYAKQTNALLVAQGVGKDLDPRRHRQCHFRPISLNHDDDGQSGMQANQLKDIRAVRDDVALLNYSSLQQTLRRLNKAFQAFRDTIVNADLIY